MREGRTHTNRAFATTFLEGFGDGRFAARARRLDVPLEFENLESKPFRPLNELRLFLRVVFAAISEEVLVLFSSRGRLKPELLAVVLVGLWPRKWRPAIVLYGEMWEPTPGIRAPIERLVVRLADRAVVRYVVFSEEETRVFPLLWGVSAAKMRYSSFHRLVRDSDDAPMESADHVFAGGNSFRDYRPLIEAAAHFPDVSFRLCSTKPLDVEDLPSNVDYGGVTSAQFDELLRTARIVVVPMRIDVHRMVGVMTYLEAMWQRKPTIVTDSIGAREYVRDTETGLVVDGTVSGYVEALGWLLDPQNEDAAAAMCDRAHAEVRDRFTLESYVTDLLGVVDEVFELRA